MTATHPGEAWRPLQEYAADADLTCIIVSSYQAVSYFAGIALVSQFLIPDRGAYLIVPARGEPILLVCNIELSQVREQTAMSDVRQYVEFADDPVTVLAQVVRDRHLDGRVGIEGRRIAVAGSSALTTALPGASLVAVDAVIERHQSVKSTNTRDALAGAARATQRAIELAIDETRPGHLEVDVTAAIFAHLARAGAVPMFAFFAAGPRTVLAHPEGEGTPVKVGDVWRTDVGARFGGGIMSDIARCGTVGPADPAQRSAFALLRAAQQSALDAIAPGRRAGDVYAAARNRLRAGGHELEIPHVGHGIGIGAHEAPILHPGNDDPLLPGMVMNVEPILFLRDRREAYHTEDLVVVTEDGHLLLTEPQAELLEVRS